MTDVRGFSIGDEVYVDVDTLHIVDGIIRVDDLLETGGWAPPEREKYWRAEVEARRRERDTLFAQATAESTRLRQLYRTTKDELAQLTRQLEATKVAFEETKASLRTQLTEALQVEDDEITPLAVYVDTLARRARAMAPGTLNEDDAQT